MLREDLRPITEVRRTTKGQVRHRFGEQRKVPGSLLEDSFHLTKNHINNACANLTSPVAWIQPQVYISNRVSK